MALSTTIKQLQELEAAEEAKAARGDRPRMVAAWRQDIAWVYGTIRNALVAYEGRGLAIVGYDKVEMTEELLGTEHYDRLNIEIVGRRVIVAPIARFTVAGTGRLDMYRSNRPSEENRVLILRGLPVPEFDPGTWWIEMKGEAPARPPGPLNGYSRGGRRFRIVEPSSIEGAVDYLLQLP